MFIGFAAILFSPISLTVMLHAPFAVLLLVRAEAVLNPLDVGKVDRRVDAADHDAREELRVRVLLHIAVDRGARDPAQMGGVRKCALVNDDEQRQANGNAQPDLNGDEEHAQEGSEPH